jgi:hypothetical protein
MRPSLTEPPFKEVSCVVRKMNQPKISSLSTLHLCLWVLKLLVEFSPKSYQKDLSSQPKNHKLSQLIKTTNKPSQFKSLKEKDHLPKTTINWESLIYQESHQLQEEAHKLRLLLKLTLTESYKFKLKIKEPDPKIKLSSQMIKEDCQKKKLNVNFFISKFKEMLKDAETFAE